jgi:small-conductance mechanosensitive channel
MQQWLQTIFLGNTIQNWLISIGIITALLLLIRVFRMIVLQKLKAWTAKTNTTIDDFFISITERSILPILNVAAIYAGLRYLWISDAVKKIFHIVIAVIITFYMVRLITSVLQHSLELYLRKQERAEEKMKQLKGIMLVVNLIVWTLGLIFLLDNLGYNVTAVVTGLGIGGIAIALAVQKILGDLFCYFVIFFDRPFEIGDFIIVDDFKGTIEHVGLKTTRLRSLDGEELIFSNTDLTNSRIHNYKKMFRRRVVFKIGVEYSTTEEQLKKIPAIITEIIKGISSISLDRVHFTSFGSFSLDYEIVYYVESGEYNFYMDIQQDINLKIYKAFAAEGISFAFPTQTLLMQAPNDELISKNIKAEL